MKRECLVMVILLVLSLIMPASTYSGTEAVDTGVSWLISNQDQDGTWGSDEELFILDTTTVLDTLYSLGETDTAYTDGIAWLSNETALITDFMSRRMITLYN